MQIAFPIILTDYSCDARLNYLLGVGSLTIKIQMQCNCYVFIFVNYVNILIILFTTVACQDKLITFTTFELKRL